MKALQYLSLPLMEEILRKLADLQREIDAFVVTDKETLEAFRVRFLGSKNVLKDMFAEMKMVPSDQKKAFGQRMNELKARAEEKFQSAQHSWNQQRDETVLMDLSLPAEPIPLGSLHPISLVRQRILDIFNTLGFRIAEGPEIEDDWHNFTALNMHEDHPARDMQDTFYISRNPDWVLRTHTSSVQVRVMEKGELPIRIVCPGRVYRNETISARAHCFFHQVEGLYVDDEVSFADLKQTLYYFVKEMFGPDTQIRFRPSYFPFTEPSAEMDISCLICGGSGCNVCKHTGWVEILGCGMVHPNMLRNCGIDPDVYSGFAFGMGVERITMLKYQIRDLRMFSENDVRFLKQFEGA